MELSVSCLLMKICALMVILCAMMYPSHSFNVTVNDTNVCNTTQTYTVTYRTSQSRSERYNDYCSSWSWRQCTYYRIVYKLVSAVRQVNRSVLTCCDGWLYSNTTNACDTRKLNTFYINQCQPYCIKSYIKRRRTLFC